MTLSDISHRLGQLQFNAEVINLYNEQHRYYHTIEHIQTVLKDLNDAGLLKHDELFLTAIFHDIVYHPKSRTNEEDSAEFFMKEAASTSLTAEQKEHIKQLILDTKTHIPTVKFSEEFIKADLAIFNASFDKLLNY